MYGPCSPKMAAVNPFPPFMKDTSPLTDRVYLPSPWIWTNSVIALMLWKWYSETYEPRPYAPGIFCFLPLGVLLPCCEKPKLQGEATLQKTKMPGTTAPADLWLIPSQTLAIWVNHIPSKTLAIWVNHLGRSRLTDLPLDWSPSWHHMGQKIHPA